MQNEHLIKDWREAWKAEADENARLRVEIERLKLMLIEATNPDIDMEQVKAARAAQRDGQEAPDGGS